MKSSEDVKEHSHHSTAEESEALEGEVTLESVSKGQQSCEMLLKTSSVAERVQEMLSTLTCPQTTEDL